MRLLLIGGGHAHIAALRAIRKRPIANMDITLVTPFQHTLYSGMLPGYVAGHWDRFAIQLDLTRICRNAGASIRFDTICKMDPERNIAEGVSGETFNFDYASIDVGRGGQPLEALNNHSQTIATKPLENFLDKWDQLNTEWHEQSYCPEIAIIGAGLAGIEIAFAISFALRRLHPTVTLLEKSPELLPNSPASLRQAISRSLSKLGVELRLGATVSGSEARKLWINDGTPLKADLVITATGGAGWPWLENTELSLRDGLIVVNESLQSLSHPHIFAAGDATHFDPIPLPPAGLYAIRQGETLANAFHALATGEPLPEFTPQTDYLKLITLGAKRAVAEKWGVSLSTPGLWHFKRAIDIAHMKKDR